MASRPHPDIDEHFMGEALTLAESALGFATPNPAVGCVVVRGGRIIGRGATAHGGRPHAETVALAQAGKNARGATAYVSLEPCAHHGQTPPCAQALINARVGRVVVGCIDSFPRVRGKGIDLLRRAGIAVTVGVLEDECRETNEGFFTRVSTGRPMIVLKLAATLDGRIAAESGDSRWISSEESRALVHRWRRWSDAVMVGAGTVIADNPRLTCRERGGRDPVRVVVDARLRTSPRALVFTERSNAPAIVVTTPNNRARATKRYASPRCEVVAARAAGGEISLAPVLAEFGRRGWNRVMIEGGAHLAGLALRQRVVDRVAFFIAPKILGGGLSAVAGLHLRTMKDAIGLEDVSVYAVSADLLVEARPAAR